MLGGDMKHNIPLLCLNCGNAVLTLRDNLYERNAKSIAMSGCINCDKHGEGWETFYVGQNNEMLSFGQWCDQEELY